MAYGRKLLLSSNSTSNGSLSEAQAQAPSTVNLETDFVVVVAALLCAIICVLGLVVVARCAWLRRGVEGLSINFGGGNRLANKGVKKKVLNSLPKYTHHSTSSSSDDDSNSNSSSNSNSDCAICLAEYGDGDEIRVLPQCGHEFHVLCIDKWLGSHSSCPSCRQILVVTRCHKCGEFPTVCGGGGEPGAFGPAKLTPVSSSAASTSAITFLP